MIVGLAVSGRDRPLPDVHRIFGPFASAVPVRSAAAQDDERAEDFGEALRRIVAETEEARRHEDIVPRNGDGLPLTSQFFFTFLDFSVLASPQGQSLTVSWDDWDDGDSAFAPPSSATDVFLAVRPEGAGLRVTVRGSAAALSASALEDFARRCKTGSCGPSACATHTGRRLPGERWERWTPRWSDTCPHPATWRGWRVCPRALCNATTCARCCSPTARRACWRRSKRPWAGLVSSSDVSGSGPRLRRLAQRLRDLLRLGDVSREIAEELPPAAAAGYLAQPWLEGTLASCRVESLLHAADPELPLVHGLVDGSAALAYWEAVERAGVTAGPAAPAGPHRRAG